MRNLTIINLAILVLLPIQSHAAFSVPGKSKSSEPYYGNAQTYEFERAVRGNIPFDKEDNKQLSKRITTPIHNSAYVKMGLQFAKTKVEDIHEAGSITGTVTEIEFEDNVNNVEMGIGYKWNNWRWELAWHILDSVDYNPTPVITGAGTLRNMRSSVSGHALLTNFIRDYAAIFKIHPYVGFGFGAFINKVEADILTTGNVLVVSDDNREITYALDAMVGFRYRLSNAFWLDAKYLHLVTGKSTWGPVDAIDLESDCLSSSGFTVGFNYQF